MKKSLIFLSAGIIVATIANAQENLLKDTTFQYQDKTIKLADDNGQLSVKIFKSGINNDSVEYKQVYEGVFSDEKSFEKYTVLEDFGFQIPGVTKKKKEYHKYNMQAHWAGFSVGFCNVVKEVSINEYEIASFNGTKVDPGTSFEWSLNLNEFIIPVYKDVFGLTTGIGLSWRNYCLENNMHLEEIDGVVAAYPADDGINYKSSRLRMLHLTFPAFLEWQPHFGENHSIYVTAGVVGNIKAFSNYKIKYENAEGTTIKRKTAGNLNIPPLSLDYMVQLGYKDFGFYAKYSPFNLFRLEEGPEMQTVSLGVTLNFND